MKRIIFALLVIASFNASAQTNDSAKYLQYPNNYGIRYPRVWIDSNATIGTTKSHNSAILAINSTTKGFLAPRMTATQKNAIATPATGLMVFDTDSAKYFYYNGSAWASIGGGSSGGSASAPSTEVVFGTGSGITSTNKITVNSSQGKLLYDSSVAISGRFSYLILNAANSTYRKLGIWHHNSNVFAGIYSNETLSNGAWNPVASFGINEDYGNGTFGGVRFGVEGEYYRYLGAPFPWIEAHIERYLRNGQRDRMYSFEGSKWFRDGSTSLRSDIFTFFHYDGDSVGVNKDSVMATITPSGLHVNMYEGGDGITLRHHRSNDYLRFLIDSTNNRIDFIHTKPVYFSGSVHLGGSFTNQNSHGYDVQLGSTVFSAAGTPGIGFASGGVLGRGRIQFNLANGGIGINTPNLGSSHDGTNYGIEFLMSNNTGSFDNGRIISYNSAGASALSFSINESGRVGLGTAAATERFAVKGTGNSSSTFNTVFYNSSNTELFKIRDDGRQIISRFIGGGNKYLIVDNNGIIDTTSIAGGGGGGGITFDSTLANTDQVLYNHTSNVRTINIGGTGKELYVFNGGFHLNADFEVDNPVGAQVGLKSSLAIFGTGQVLTQYAPNGITNGNAGTFANSSLSTSVEYIVDGLNHPYLGFGTVVNAVGGYARLTDGRGTAVAPLVRKFSKPSGGSSVVDIGSEAEDGGTSFAEMNATTISHVTIASNTTSKSSLLLKESSVDPSSSYADGMIWHKNDHLYIRLNGTNYQLDQQGGGSGSLIISAVSTTPNANGLSYNSGTGDFNLQPASATHPGVMTALSQSLAGQKTWSNVLKYNSDLRASYDDRTLVDFGNLKSVIHDSLQSLVQVYSVDFSSTNATPANIWDIVGADEAFGSTMQTITIEVVCNAKKDGSSGTSGAYAATKIRSFQWDGSTLTAFSTTSTPQPDNYISGLSTATFAISASGSNIVIPFTGESSTNITGNATIKVTRTKIFL
jgi:hypothetical protein